MRDMRDKKTKRSLRISEHIILKNFWEYYVIEDEKNTEDNKLCLVLGFENEIGCVSMQEIAPYVLSRTQNLKNVMPAPGYEWVQ